MSSLKYQGPVVLVVMDGVGLAEDNPYNAVTRAHAETLHELMAKYPMAKLGAAGHYVGIPDGDMGNSEVGNNAMGSDLTGTGCSSATSSSGVFVADDGAAADASSSGNVTFSEVGQTITLTNDSSTEITGVFNKKPSL